MNGLEGALLTVSSVGRHDDDDDFVGFMALPNVFNMGTKRDKGTKDNGI